MTSGIESTTPSVYSVFKDEFDAVAADNGYPKWRGTQIWQWLYRDYADCWEAMQNIPKAMRADMSRLFRDLDSTAKIKEESDSREGTGKLLMELCDGELIETVIIPSRDRNTVCVSSQAGCAFGCAFCASGLNGVSRNLEAGEIVAQIIRVSQLLGKRPDNVVFMGIGEPFANYDNVLKAAHIMNDPDGCGIGARKITVSTCGVVPGIKRFAGEGMQFELSVSLHAPNDELRGRIMPVNKRWGIEELMDTCRWYTDTTNRIITFEYTLIKGFNNLPKHASELVRLLKGLKCRVNLIPLNPVKEFDGEAPAPGDCEKFLQYMTEHGVNTTLRRSKGRGVDASCGQLRHRRRN